MLRGIHRCIDCAEEIARRYQTECQKIQNHQDGLDCFYYFFKIKKLETASNTIHTIQ